MVAELERADALMVEGEKAINSAQYAAAMKCFEEALAIRLPTLGEENPEVATTFHFLGYVCDVLGDHAAALAHYMRALTIRRRTLGKAHPAVAASLNNLGVLSESLGDYAAAQDYYLQALAIRRQAFGDAHKTVAGTLSNLGNVSRHLGDYFAAQDYHLQALAITRQALGEAHPDVATGLNNLGVVVCGLGNFLMARGYWEQAVAIQRQALGELHPNVAATLANLGVVSRILGDCTAARDYHTQALAIRRQVLGEIHPDTGGSLMNLGNVSAELGDYAEARDYFERALAIRRQTLGEVHPEVATTLNNLGNVFWQLGEYRTAQDYHLQALTIRRQVFGEAHRDVAMSLHNLGAVSAELRDRTAARDYYEQALTVYRQTLGDAHPDTASTTSNLGEVSRELGNFVAARRHYEQAVTIVRQAFGDAHSALCHPLLGLAKVNRAEGSFDKAAGLIEQALRIALMPDNVDELPEAYRQLSLLKAAAGAPDAAIFFGKQAVNAIQRHRARLTGLTPELQRSFLSRKENIYRDLSDGLVEAGRLGEAHQVLEMLKEEELFDLLRRDTASDPRLTLAQLTSLEAEWQRHGDALGQDLVRLTERVSLLRKIADRTAEQEAGLREFRAALDAAGREFRTWLDSLRVELFEATVGSAESRHSAALNLDLLERLQGELRALGSDVALLSYVLGERKLSIILTTGTFQMSREAEISERNVNRLVHEFRLAIDQRLNADIPRIGQALWRHLIEPVIGPLQDIAATTLMVVPYGTLRYLPFSALHDGKRYLAEQFAVSILTLAAHANIAGRGTVDWRVAGMGVSREVPGYRRLLAVGEELAGIVRTAAGGAGVYPGTIRLDEAFTEQNFAEALDAHQVVHVASHFVLNPAQGLNSHLLLGDGTTLSLDRLRDVSFDFHRLELMTLSACETAMGGGGENGREFEGFAALVQQRGVKAVIASLWPVADESTAPLMKAFYRARLAGRSKAAALQEAQLSLLHGPYAHPYHWAPFLLMGNWL
jgi:CHAT domain-containing protein/Tfp pilus assembly protein PilF